MFSGFGAGILVWCSNGGFRGLVWCFQWCFSVSLVVEERERDEEIREKSIVFFFFYLFCILYYFIELCVKIRTEMLDEL